MSTSNTPGSSVAEFGARADANQQAVIATNDDAFESKIAAMDAGYFEDPFLLYMKRRFQKLQSMKTLDAGIQNIRTQWWKSQFRREPVINRGTFGRILIKQRLIGAIFDEVVDAERHVQIISLGAGFDTFGFNLLQQEFGALVLNYVEVDLKPVVKQKLDLVEEFLQDGGGDALAWKVEHHENCCFHAKLHESDSQYWLKSCDLRDLSELSKVFQDVGFVRGRATIILAELSLVYMEVDESDAVIRWLGEWLTGDRTFVCLEPIQGTDQFGKHMDSSVAARGSPFLGTRVYGDVDAQQKRFKKNGWSSVRARTMWDEWRRIVSPQRMMELQRIELLDEVEEFELLLSHYCVVVAAVGKREQQITEVVFP